MRLAREIVTMYHSADAAEIAEAGFVQTFSEGGIPDDIHTVTVSPDALLQTVLVEQDVVPSNSEFRSLIDGGAITHIEKKKKITDAQATAQSGVYKIGKRRFIRIGLH